MASNNRDLCQQITNRLIESLEQDTCPWQCPWDRTQTFDIPVNKSTGDVYHGMNVVQFWAYQAERRYSTAHWLTYKQAQQLGGQVRKGERATPGVFYTQFEKATDQVDDNGDPVTEQVRVVRGFKVFNLDQVDGLEPPDTRPRFGFEPISGAERVLAGAGISIRHGGARACYAPGPDTITLPDRNRFTTANDYYATAIHELTHATAHVDRCNRPRYETSVTDGAYAFEELVAELGSLFTMAALGLSGEVVNHDSYIAGWLRVLAEDKRAIFKAAAQAETAHQWLIGCLDTLPQAA
ncbi:ArdC family protein [Salinisphaera orenii]|uniref:ArdC family protein n=1 Tax=Salinisphaera orenii TaxID=856731 RepID=UPI000DBEA598